MYFNKISNNGGDDKNSSLVKITFTGDIMCAASEINASGGNNQYDFSDKFKECKNYFAQSDYVIGNLETPIANAEYSHHKYEFNSPIGLIKALQECGFSLITTANNHCLDRGRQGLIDTINAFDGIKLKHIGTNKIRPENTTGIIETINNIKIGILSYTYGTNAFANNHFLQKNEKWMVNLFQDQELHNVFYRKLYNSFIFRLMRRIINKLSRIIIGLDFFCPIYERTERRYPFIKNMKKDILSLKNCGAEYTIMCLHTGGQYHKQPLRKTKKIIDRIINCGVNAVICNHEHVVQECQINSDKIKIFSLGNFTALTGIREAPYEKMTEYSVLFNLYLSKKSDEVVPQKCSFSIIKIIPVDNGKVTTVLLYDLINNCYDKNEKNKLIVDNLKIYNIFTKHNKREIELKLEYFIDL
jgi:poly-gamma-glutamate synthesis protein (capsule biosynthesis protein)